MLADLKVLLDILGLDSCRNQLQSFLSMLVSLPKYLRILLVNDVATICAKITTANKGFISSLYCY